MITSFEDYTKLLAYTLDHYRFTKFWVLPTVVLAEPDHMISIALHGLQAEYCSHLLREPLSCPCGTRLCVLLDVGGWHLSNSPPPRAGVGLSSGHHPSDVFSWLSEFWVQAPSSEAQQDRTPILETSSTSPKIQTFEEQNPIISTMSTLYLPESTGTEALRKEGKGN